MAERVYPADVQAVLDRGREEGWTVEVYQAALSIALHHLRRREARELVVQYAEEEIPDVPVFRFGLQPDGWGMGDLPVQVQPGYYLVCPWCCSLTNVQVEEQMSTVRWTSWHEEPDELPLLMIGEVEEAECVSDEFVCDVANCRRPLTLPDWMEGRVEYE